MLEVASCSALRPAENPAVDCAALQQLKTGSPQEFVKTS
jgi:hypothetical protein